MHGDRERLLGGLGMVVNSGALLVIFRFSWRMML
jgi:hypothetical protein